MKTQSKSFSDDHAPLLERAFSFSPEESSYLIEHVKGELPESLRGTYYISGPSCFSSGTQQYRHWLDGDGMITALDFGAEGVRCTSRFVRSEKRIQEEEAGKALYRTFGTAFEGDQLVNDMALLSPVNVSVHHFSKKLLAFGEQGLPYEVDPVTLETVGKYRFRNQLNDISPFSAHPHIDRIRNEMFNFGVSFSKKSPKLNLYRFGGEEELIYRKRHDLEHPFSIHDFGLSPRYLCFYISPLILDISRMLEKNSSVIDALTWEPALGSQMLILNRESGDPLQSIPLVRPDGKTPYCLHFINLWEDEDSVVVDLIELDEPAYGQYMELPEPFTTVQNGRPVRYVISTTTWTVVDRIELDYEHSPDFGALDPRKYLQECDDFYMLGISATGKPGRKWFDQLIHCRWSEQNTQDRYQAAPGEYLCGEPIYLPCANNQGRIICQIFDANRETGYFALFDPENVSKGPVVTLELKTPVPLSLHASFVPEGAFGGRDIYWE